MAKMTEALKGEAVRMYFEEGREVDEIAAELGVMPRQVMAVLNNPKRLEPYRRRAEAARLRAQIRVSESAEEAARKQAALLQCGEKGSTVGQRAAKDILDRAGVGVQKDAKQEVTIRFADGVPRLGMPRALEADDGD